MLFKSFSVGATILPTGYCAGVDCGPYKCNEASADAKATEAISVQENKHSSKNASTTTA